MRWRSVGRSGPVVVLLHGYAAPPDDLVPFARALVSRRSVRVVLPEGPIDHFGCVRSWYGFDTERHWTALRADRHETLEAERPDGLARVCGPLLDLMLGLRTGFGGPPPILGGFSQGATTAAELAFRTGLPLSGLALFSAGTMASEHWPSSSPNRAGLPALLAHGRSDAVLPHRLSNRLERRLRGLGLEISRFDFEGGHEIQPALIGMVALVDRVWPSCRPWSPPDRRRAPVRRSSSIVSSLSSPSIVGSSTRPRIRPFRSSSG